MLYIIFLYVKIYYLLFIGKKIYPARCACLGLDAIDNLYSINRQKFRVDGKLNNNFIRIIKLLFLSKYFINRKILKLIYQQAVNLWPLIIKKSNFFIMDTYSELTDKKFTVSGVDFFCHYSDLISNKNINIADDTLMSEIDFYIFYKIFVEYIKSFNNKIKIIIIIFPIKFEKRDIYIRRYEAINNALDKLSGDDIIIIKIPDELVIKFEDDEFPYHFSDRTKNFVKREIGKILKNED